MGVDHRRSILPISAALAISTLAAACDPGSLAPVAPHEAADAAHTLASTSSREPDRQELRFAVAPPPEPISGDEVRKLLAAADPDAGYGVEHFQRLLSLFPAARGHVAYQYLTGKALQIALDRPGKASQAFLRRLVRAQASADVGPGFVAPSIPQAECMVDFNDPDLLGAAMPNPAQDNRPGSYAQPCGDGTVRVEPIHYGHIHLDFENPEIRCYNLETGTFGYGPPGDPDCPPVEEPLAEPRYVTGHLPTEVIKVWRSAGFILIPLEFSLHYFSNVSGQPVTLRFLTEDGVWNQFNSLGGYTTWDVSAWVNDVVEVQITHVATDPPCGSDWEAAFPGGGCPPLGGNYSLDSFAINP